MEFCHVFLPETRQKTELPLSLKSARDAAGFALRNRDLHTFPWRFETRHQCDYQSTLCHS